VPSGVRRPRRWTTTVAGTVRRVAVVQSDIVSSTQLLEAAGAEYPRLLVRHRSLIAAAVARRGGSFLTYAGDGTMAVFERPDAAVLASVDAQRALAAEPWPEGLNPRVRMSVHAGDVFDIGGEPVGLAINHGARIMSVAQAGQVMVSPAAADAAEAAGGVGRGRGGLVVADAGWHELRDHCGPVRLRQVVAEGLTVVLPEAERAALVAEVPLARHHAG
jgi:class 3 adenylate cyclase